MEHLVNSRVKKIELSGIRKFFNMVADYEDVISPLGPALYNTVRPIQNVIQSVAGAAEPIYAVGEAYKNVIRAYLESDQDSLRSLLGAN